ncbi:hypothetical protein M0R45_025446 [Rubus argutus]|uniref:RING-type E3 ubiquitin transferase n=1 Tax=Rubus argutus TaxID=59490 RepID=A0AAW1WX85_RUBAR
MQRTSDPNNVNAPLYHLESWNFIRTYNSTDRRPIIDVNLTTPEVLHRKSFTPNFGIDVIETLFPIEERRLRWKKSLDDQEETSLHSFDDMKTKILGVVNGMVNHEANSVLGRKKLDVLVTVHQRYSLSSEQYQVMAWVQEALRDLRWSVGQLAIRALTESDHQEEAIRESLGQQGFVPKPASKASVKALEKSEFHGRHDSSSKCVICMEEMLTGCEVTPMPCFHIFHGDCIVKWLSHSSHTCPVCRFELPTDV